MLRKLDFLWLNVLVFKDKDEVVLNALIQVDHWTIIMALRIVIDALVDFINPEDAPGNLAVNAAHDINSPVLAAYAHFSRDILLLAQGKEPA